MLGSSRRAYKSNATSFNNSLPVFDYIVDVRHELFQFLEPVVHLPNTKAMFERKDNVKLICLREVRGMV